jgi:hypothetical protein
MVWMVVIGSSCASGSDRMEWPGCGAFEPAFVDLGNLKKPGELTHEHGASRMHV